LHTWLVHLLLLRIVEAWLLAKGWLLAIFWLISRLNIDLDLLLIVTGTVMFVVNQRISALVSVDVI
jgi:hypothetical protein